MKHLKTSGIAAGLTLIFFLSACDLEDESPKGVPAQTQPAAKAPAPPAHNPDGPDFQTTLGNTIIPIDIDLLGPNGALTVEFIRSLDPLRCEIQGSQDVQKAMLHLLAHGFPRENLSDIITKSQKRWHEIFNVPAPG